MFNNPVMYFFGLLIAGFTSLFAFIWGYLDMQEQNKNQDDWQEYVEAFKERIGQ